MHHHKHFMSGDFLNRIGYLVLMVARQALEKIPEGKPGIHIRQILNWFSTI